MSNRIGIGIDVFGAGIDADATTIYNRIIADGGVSNLTRLNFFVKGLKAIYGDLANVPVCYDAHWIGYKLGSGTGATAGQAAAKLYSLTVAGDAVQSTAASQPLLLAHNGGSSDNYWWGPSILANNVTTPNATANRITGDIDIKVYVSVITGTLQVLVNKGANATNETYTAFIQADRRIALQCNITSSITFVSTTALIGVNYTGWLRFTRNATNGDVNFYTSNDSYSTNPSSVNFTLFESKPASLVGTSLLDTQPVYIGQYSTSGAYNFLGKIYRATISNSIGGSPVVDFNPASYNASTSQTQWTSATGEVWTINTGTATVGYKGVLVSRTIVQSDGVDDNLNNLTINQLSPFTYNLSFRQFQLTAGTGSGVLGRGTSRVAMGVGNYNTKTNTIWTWAPSQLSTYGGANDMDKNLNLFQSIIPSMTETGWSMRKNNSNYGSVGETSGTPVDGGGVYLFYSGNITEYSNSIINTVVISNNAQATAQSTATYNLIRSLNNNAF